MVTVVKCTQFVAKGPGDNMWVIPHEYISSIMKKDFVELNKKDVTLRKWAVGSVAYNRKVSAVIDEIRTLRCSASKDALIGVDPFKVSGGKSSYRKWRETKKLSELEAQAGLQSVEVTLPAFTFEGTVVNERAANMVLTTSMDAAVSFEATDSINDVLNWVHERCRAIDPPACSRGKRSAAAEPPCAGGYWHKQK